jgi:hypothetical protein
MPRSLPAEPAPFPQPTSSVIKRMFGIEAYAHRGADEPEKSTPVPAQPTEHKDVVA